MTIKIDKKIVNCSVVTEEKNEQENTTKEEKKPEVKRKKNTKRPEILWGVTTKVTTTDCNIYVTVNCDPDNDRPLEVFFSSSHLESMEWVALATRLASAILRVDDPEVANLDFIAKEFIKTESPGGYLAKVLDQKKGTMVNGVISHLGLTLLAINKRLKAKAKMANAEASADKSVEPPVPEVTEEKITSSAGTCPECFSNNTQLLDNCLTCLDCAYSKCG